MLIANLPTPERITPASEIVQSVSSLNSAQREARFVELLLGGHIPTWMRVFAQFPLTFLDKSGQSHLLIMSVLPDYLCLGTDTDYVRVPMSPLAAQQVADAWNCTLPTSKIVNLVWHASSGKITPQPWGPPYDASMMSTHRIVEHNKRIEATMVKLSIEGRGELLAGHKKDVVLTNKLLAKPKQVAIYGWHQPNGKPIQPVYLGHENTYADYSHGIRMVSRVCELDDNVDDITRIMQDPQLHVVVSDEGPMTITKQPT